MNHNLKITYRISKDANMSAMYRNELADIIMSPDDFKVDSETHDRLKMSGIYRLS